LIQQLVKGIKSFNPEFSVGFYPIRHFVQFLKLGFAISFSALFFDNNETALDQNFNMLGDGGPAHFKIFRYGIQVQGLVSNQVDDFPSGRLGYFLKCISSGFHGFYL